MDEAKKSEIAQWLSKAHNDLASAKVLVQNELRDTGVYHCQQTAEKSLKAYLVFRDVPLMKVHDVTALVKQCVVLDDSFNQLMDLADVLSPYATAFRYPGDVSEPDSLDAIEALKLAGKVLDFVSQKVRA